MPRQGSKARDPWTLFKVNGSERWYYKHPNNQKQATGTTQRSDAVAIVEAARQRWHDEQRYGAGSVLTFQEATAKWLMHKKRQGETITKPHKKHLTALVCKFGDYRIAHIRQDDLDQYCEELQAGRDVPYSPASLDLMVHSRFITIWRFVSRSYDLPSRAWARPKKAEPTPRPVGDAEWLAKFVAACAKLEAHHARAMHEAVGAKARRHHRENAANKVRLAALQCVLFHTGRRISSLLMSDVNLKAGTISVPKSKQSKAVVLPLPPDALELLRRVPFNPVKPFGYTQRGGSFTRSVRAVCTAAGIPYLTTHESGRRAAYNDVRRNHPEIEHEQGKTGLGWVPGSAVPDEVYRDVSDEEAAAVVLRKFR